MEYVGFTCPVSAFIRWDEKAGLQTGCDTLPVNDALKAQRRPAMKKISTVAIERIQIFKEKQLTIGLDLGDRTSHYCVLNEAGEVILESKLPTTPSGGKNAKKRAVVAVARKLAVLLHKLWVSG